jgi:CDP-glucose 4,6-dehydratase
LVTTSCALADLEQQLVQNAVKTHMIRFAAHSVQFGGPVLVTGATGVVGSQLVRKLLQLGADVVCFIRDHDPASALWISGDVHRVGVVTGRLEHFDHVRAAIAEREIDTIFHLGAQAIVSAGQRDPLGTFESNVRGTYHILEACRLFGRSIKRIIIASSDKAYGESESLPYIESTPLNARNPYDVSKCCADLIAQSYFHSYKLPIAIARCGNVYGPGDLHWNRLVPGTIRSLLGDQRPVIRSDGSLIRDYLYVDDAVSGYLALAGWLDAAASSRDSQRAFNFSANQPLSVLQMTRMIQDACGRLDLQPVVQSHSPGEIRAQHLDSSRALRELGWSPQANIADALRITVDWYRHYFHARNEPALRSLRLSNPLPARASA